MESASAFVRMSRNGNKDMVLSQWMFALVLWAIAAFETGRSTNDLRQTFRIRDLINQKWTR